MRLPEQKIYDRLVRELTGKLPKGRWRVQRIETGTATGVPDLYFRYGDLACWLETKTLNYGVSKEQYAWAHREQLAGGRCWIVTVIGGELVFLDFDMRMMDYSTLGAYVRNVEHLELSLEGWLEDYG